MTIASSSAASITASDLADRLAPGEGLTVLDVRDDASWAIEAPGVTTRRVPAAAVLADPAATARDLAGPVAVVCNRGVMAQSVSHALRAEGVAATVLEGGMRGWITDIVDTHLHADHLSGARALAALTGANRRLPAAAIERGVAYAVTALHDDDTITLGDVTIRAVSLPGHTTDMTGLFVAGRATGQRRLALCRRHRPAGPPAGRSRGRARWDACCTPRCGIAS
ncbi:MAG TPA: rhodanese-like domain-containing protein [Baekduia sp.]|nr:rhodanese-like domain-containing protein [Baekduia sp.]